MISLRVAEFSRLCVLESLSPRVFEPSVELLIVSSLLPKSGTALVSPDGRVVELLSESESSGRRGVEVSSH